VVKFRLVVCKICVQTGVLVFAPVLCPQKNFLVHKNDTFLPGVSEGFHKWGYKFVRTLYNLVV